VRNLRHELVHELAHSLVAAEGDRDDLTLNYAQEELVVESVTYTVAGALGLRVDGYAIPYLRDLANSGGQTFRYPQTRAEASAEIRRLRARRPDSRLARAVERREGERAAPREQFDAAAVRPQEISGYGSHARWAAQDNGR
jgi:hypothetical protein